MVGIWPLVVFELIAIILNCLSDAGLLQIQAGARSTLNLVLDVGSQQVVEFIN